MIYNINSNLRSTSLLRLIKKLIIISWITLRKIKIIIYFNGFYSFLGNGHLKSLKSNVSSHKYVKAHTNQLYFNQVFLEFKSILYNQLFRFFSNNLLYHSVCNSLILEIYWIKNFSIRLGLNLSIKLGSGRNSI